MLSMASRVVAAVLLVGLSPSVSLATSVRAVTVGEMATRAQIIFEGRVVTVESRLEAPPGSIRTCVLFDVVDLVKGEAFGNTLELCFAGGSVDQRTRLISGMVYPERGETGIYFIEAIDQPLVNPIYGWDQGRFLIRVLPGDSGPSVTVADGAPVVALEPGNARSAATLSHGVAIGVEVDEGRSGRSQQLRSPEGDARASDTDATRTPLDPEDFKAAIRSMIGSGDE